MITNEEFEQNQNESNVIGSYVGLSGPVIQLSEIQEPVDLLVALDAIHFRIVELEEENGEFPENSLPIRVLDFVNELLESEISDD